MQHWEAMCALGRPTQRNWAMCVSSVLHGYRPQELGSLMTIVCDGTIWVRPQPLPLHPYP